MNEFVLYQRYAAAEQAEPLLALLRQRNIPFEAHVDPGAVRFAFDPSFANNAPYAQFLVHLQAADVEWVRELEAEASRHTLVEVAPDHYLFTFSDAELMDILVKPDEWNNLDVTLAGQLLRQRGHDVSAEQVRQLRQNRVREQARPEPSQRGWIIFGYVVALLGGFMAVFIGAHLHWHRKTLLDGQRPYAFSAADRVHGFRIFVLGLLMSALVIVLRVMASLGAL